MCCGMLCQCWMRDNGGTFDRLLMARFVHDGGLGEVLSMVVDDKTSSKVRGRTDMMAA